MSKNTSHKNNQVIARITSLVGITILILLLASQSSITAQQTTPDTTLVHDQPEQIDITQSTTAFVSTWNTSAISSGSTATNQITLPLSPAGSYDFTVNWGDGTSDTITVFDQAEVTHTYAEEGIYTVTIEGQITGFVFNNGGDRLKIIEISQWGSLNLGNSGDYFYGCENLDLTTTEAIDLTGTTSLTDAFRNSGVDDSGALNTWDVSSVTHTSDMFNGASNFDQSLDSWDTSSVIFMDSMFKDASRFNHSLDNWNTSAVTEMWQMFDGASSFNQPLNSWNTSSVIFMWKMFNAASSFNQPLDNWNTTSVTRMRLMFNAATRFNQPLNSWDTSAVVDMEDMFNFASSFNQPLNNWDVSSVTHTSDMFNGASNFDQSLDSWDIIHSIQGDTEDDCLRKRLQGFGQLFTIDDTGDVERFAGRIPYILPGDT